MKDTFSKRKSKVKCAKCQNIPIFTVSIFCAWLIHNLNSRCSFEPCDRTKGENIG